MPENHRDPLLDINQSPDGFGGVPGSGGAKILMTDGSVKLLSEKIEPEILRRISVPEKGRGYPELLE